MEERIAAKLLGFWVMRKCGDNIDGWTGDAWLNCSTKVLLPDQKLVEQFKVYTRQTVAAVVRGLNDPDVFIQPCYTMTVPQGSDETLAVWKIGTDAEPASKEEIDAFRQLLADTKNDPDKTIVWHHAVELLIKHRTPTVLEYFAAHAPPIPEWDFALPITRPAEPARADSPSWKFADASRALAANWWQDRCYDLSKTTSHTPEQLGELTAFQAAWDDYYAALSQYDKAAQKLRRTMWPWVWARAVLDTKQIIP